MKDLFMLNASFLKISAHGHTVGKLMLRGRKITSVGSFFTTFEGESDATVSKYRLIWVHLLQ